MSVLIRTLIALVLVTDLQSQQPHTIVAIGNTHLVSFKPECNPLQRRFDPVWINQWGWTMPRVGWHALYPATSIAIAKGLTKLGVNRKVAAVGASLGLGLIPHLRQAALGLRHNGVYELNAPDYVFDLWNRSLPTFAMLSDDAHTTRRDVGIWFAGDVLLSCFGSP